MKAVKLREGNYLGNLGLCLISERKPRFCVFGHLCHSFLVQILPTWLSGLKVWQKPEPTISDDLDPALQSQQHWAAISGKRARKTEAFVKSLAVDMGTKLTILFIVDEPLRFLTFQFMKFSDVANTNPTLVQFANKGRSPLLAATQYLSSLLLENPQMGPGRLILIWKKPGFRSVSEWEEARPADVRALRRLVLLCCSWVQRRHSDNLEQFPFSLCLFADNEASESDKEALARKWDSTPECCVRPGFACQLKKRGVSGERLKSDSKCPDCIHFPLHLCHCPTLLDIVCIKYVNVQYNIYIY